jgi:hypothetical protein
MLTSWGASLLLGKSGSVSTLPGFLKSCHRFSSTNCMAQNSKASRPTMLKGRSTLVGASYQKMSGRAISCGGEAGVKGYKRRVRDTKFSTLLV